MRGRKLMRVALLAGAALLLGAAAPAASVDEPIWERFYLKELVGLLGAIAALVTLVKSPAQLRKLHARLGTLRRAWRLHRACGASRSEALATMRDILRPDWGLFTLPNEAIVERSRRRIEHGIFRPRPTFSWPLPEDHPDGDKYLDRTPEDRRRVLERIHAARLAEWRAGIAKIHEAPDGQIIKILHPGRITARQQDIQTYFAAAAEIIGGERGNRFITPVEVRTGFIAPLHLLSGLLVHFSENWPSIIDSFNMDGRHSNDIDFGDRSADIRQIQLFIYNCWLLWGPSIPICKPTCGMWDGDVITMQYGYGDEANSIDIVGLAGTGEGNGSSLTAQVQRLIDQEKDRIEAANAGAAGDPARFVRRLTAMALPASVTGYLRSSQTLKKHVGGRDVSRLPAAAQRSYLGEQDDRPLLYVDTIERTDAEAKAFPIGLAKQGGQEPARYYSAYLWVAFVILGKSHEAGLEKPVWRPVHRARLDKSSMDYRKELDDGSEKPWFDLIPFFEHGNIADSETCAFLKRQLARKIVGAFLEVLQSLDLDDPRHRFAYACAIDDPGCTPDHFLMPDLQGGDTLKATIRQMLDEGEKTDPRYAAIKKIVDFDAYAREYHPLAACTFPTHIDGHYTQMAKLEKGLRQWRARNNSGYQDYFDEDPYWEAHAAPEDRPATTERA